MPMRDTRKPVPAQRVGVGDDPGDELAHGAPGDAQQ